MKSLILAVIILIVAGSAAMYLYRAKKRGEHCIGCPYAKECGGKACGSSGNEKR